MFLEKTFVSTILILALYHAYYDMLMFQSLSKLEKDTDNTLSGMLCFPFSGIVVTLIGLLGGLRIFLSTSHAIRWKWLAISMYGLNLFLTYTIAYSVRKFHFIYLDLPFREFIHYAPTQLLIYIIFPILMGIWLLPDLIIKKISIHKNTEYQLSDKKSESELYTLNYWFVVLIIAIIPIAIYSQTLFGKMLGFASENICIMLIILTVSIVISLCHGWASGLFLGSGWGAERPCILWTSS